MSNDKFAGRPPPPPVDLIDTNDHVIGQADYLTVHQKGLLHRYVHGVVLNSAREILLQKRSIKNRNYPLTFDASIGGHVDAGESYETAVLREAKEEIGLRLNVTDLTYLGRISNFDLPTENMLGQLYLIRHDGPFDIDPDEVESVSWQPLKQCLAQFQAQPELFCKNFHASLELLKSLPD